MAKLGRLPVIARLSLAQGLISKNDIEASQKLTIDPALIEVHEKEAST
jgi:hypothetical protein